MDLQIDEPKMMAFLVGLLQIASPTGDAQRALAFVQAEFAALPLALTPAPKGHLLGTWEGAAADAPRAVTAHVDTLGAMVSGIKANGRLRLSRLGGYSWNAVEGEGVTVLTGSGDLRGTILPVAASVHAYTAAEREAARTDENVELRLDAHTGSIADTEALGVRVGDFVTLDPRVELGESGFIRSRHLDDKAGVAAIYGAVDAVIRSGRQPRQRTTLHISSYEEVGHGAAGGLPPDLQDLLTVDMAVVAPGQNSTETAVTICAKDAGGPYHLAFRRQLERLAQKYEIEYRTDIYRYYRSDGGAYWRAGGDVRVALIGPGVDASHHYERTHRQGVAQTARLIAAYLLN